MFPVDELSDGATARTRRAASPFVRRGNRSITSRRYFWGLASGDRTDGACTSTSPQVGAGGTNKTAALYAVTCARTMLFFSAIPEFRSLLVICVGAGHPPAHRPPRPAPRPAERPRSRHRRQTSWAGWDIRSPTSPGTPSAAARDHRSPQRRHRKCPGQRRRILGKVPVGEQRVL